jgi:hypothetical protein
MKFTIPGWDISRQAKGFLTRPSAKRYEELLNLSRNQVIIMMRLSLKRTSTQTEASRQCRV